MPGDYFFIPNIPYEATRVGPVFHCEQCMVFTSPPSFSLPEIVTPLPFHGSSIRRQANLPKQVEMGSLKQYLVESDIQC